MNFHKKNMSTIFNWGKMVLIFFMVLNFLNFSYKKDRRTGRAGHR